jgi:outer membrane protein assembly complex protein YaeT
VRKIRFEGVSRFDDDDLIEYLHLSENSPLSALGLTEKSYLVKGRIREDKRRLVQLYNSAGYYDTRIVDVRVEKRNPRSSKVIVTFVVDEGEPIIVDEVELIFARKIKKESKVARVVTLRKGEPADIEVLNKSKEALNKALLDLGYALAQVKESMDVSLEKKTASARFEIDPGPLCKIGDISLSGLSRVPDDLVLREVEGFKGFLYTPETKKEIEDKLLAMSVFSVVAVSPDDTLDDSGTLPLNVLLVEGEMQTLKLGIGFAVEPNKQLGRIGAVYVHRNLFSHLYELKIKSTVGYAALPTFWEIDSHGPVAELEPSISKKGLLEKELRWVLGSKITTDIDEEFKYFSPTVRLSVSRLFFKRTLASLSYNFEYYFVYDETERWRRAVDEVIPQSDSPFRLAYLESVYRVMLTDRLADPQNGVVLEMRYALAGTSIGSQSQYNKVDPFIAFYWQIFSHLQLAVRVETGLILPFGKTTETGIWSNFFLGGFNSMRGWGGKKLAPSVELCVEENDCETIHIGGRTMVLGNVELRIRTVESLYVVAFFDAGDVQYDVLTYVPEEWNYTAGGGIRIQTPVGKIRMDMGYRINNPDAYKEEPRWALHLGLGEAF